MLEVSRVEGDEDHPLSPEVRRVFANVPASAIMAVLRSDRFQAMYGHLSEAERDWFARECIVVDELARCIHRRRRRDLFEETLRPPPYHEPGVADLTLSDDRLVALSEFDVEDGVLTRNGHAFVILPPLPSSNSSYWLTRSLEKNFYRQSYVRLDPLMHGDAADFPRISYRMLFWGPPLRWEDIVNIRAEKFGRWSPGTLSTGGEFTDYAWVPRNDEQHLYLEEVPKREDIDKAGSRYLHGIFSRSRAAVTHLDGATRIYSEQEWVDRYHVHVHRTGKVGKRVKLFRTDEEIDPQRISDLGGTFFVWNYDVADFFGSPVPASSLGKAV